MKLIIAIVSKDDSCRVVRALTKNIFFVTKMATTGGFLMAGNTTLLVGTEEEKVEKALKILRENSETRMQMVPNMASYDMSLFGSEPIEVQVGGATVFVLDVERFLKL